MCFKYIGYNQSLHIYNYRYSSVGYVDYKGGWSACACARARACVCVRGVRERERDGWKEKKVDRGYSTFSHTKNLKANRVRNWKSGGIGKSSVRFSCLQKIP